MRIEVAKLLEDLKEEVKKIKGPPIEQEPEGVDTAQITG